MTENKQFDEERSLYNLQNETVNNCRFEGPQDGESVLKETRNCSVENCFFSLRYPLWHAKNFKLINSTLNELTRAPIWYCHQGLIESTTINGIKCLRESHNIQVINCQVDSKEFGWMSSDIEIKDSKINSEYFLMKTDRVKIKNLTFTGKYSFQYMNDLEIEDSYLDTKDAFWHSNNVVVRNSVVKGEYLAWFSKNLTLINCKIIGTQPFCYCEKLTLINCTMEQTDLAFEYSEVQADVKGHIDSIKNPKEGVITCDSVGEIIEDHQVMECHGKVVIRSK